MSLQESIEQCQSKIARLEKVGNCVPNRAFEGDRTTKEADGPGDQERLDIVLNLSRRTLAFLEKLKSSAAV